MKAVRRALRRLVVSLLGRRDDRRLAEEVEDYLACQTYSNIR